MKYPEVNFLPFKTPDFDNKSEEDEIAAKTTSVPFVGKTRFSVYLFVLHHYGTFIIILKCFPDFLHIQHFKVPRQFCQLCLQTKQIYCCKWPGQGFQAVKAESYSRQERLREWAV